MSEPRLPSAPQAEQRGADSAAPRVAPRRALLPLGIGTALSLIGDSTLYTVLPDPGIASQLGLAAGSVGLVLGANRIVRLLFNPIAGSLHQRLPRRPLLIGAMFVGALSTAIYGLAQGLVVVLIGRVLWGAAWAGIWVGAHAMLLDVSSEANRGRLNGAYQVWFFLGIAVTALVGGGLTDLIGLRNTLWSGAGLMALSGLFWLLTLPETHPRGEPETGRAIARLSGGYPVLPALPAAVPYFAVRLTGAGILASTTILWLGRYFEGGIPLPGSLVPLATGTGVFVALRTLVSLVGAPAAGAFSDRAGRRWGALALLLGLAAVGMAVMNAQRFVLAACGALAVALAGPGVQALVPAVIGDRLPAGDRSRALGVVFSGGDLGSALGPPLAFALLPQFQLRGVYFVGAALLLICTGYALWNAFHETARWERAGA